MIEFLSVFSSVMFLIWAACGIVRMFLPKKPMTIEIRGSIRVPRRNQDVVVIHTSDGPRQSYEPNPEDLRGPGYEKFGRASLN